MGSVTLNHTETDTRPECKVVVGAMRFLVDGKIDMSRVEITFEGCWHARTAPKRDDYGLEAEGFDLVQKSPRGVERLKWYWDQWRADGYCPISGFWVAVESRWLVEFLPDKATHYVIQGRNGFVELIAKTFSWREWPWISGHRDELLEFRPVVSSGTGELPIAVKQDTQAEPPPGASDR